MKCSTAIQKSMGTMCVLALVTGAGFAMTATPAGAVTTIASCTATSYANAVAHGGIVKFGVNCSLTPSATIVVASGKTLDLEGNGHAVTISGGDARRLFAVSGGNLTVRGINLVHGRALGNSGSAG